MCATTAKQPPASISVYFALDILIPLRGRYLEQNKTNTDIKARTVGWHILRKPISQKAIIPRKPISGKPTPGAPTFCPFINGAYRTQISSKLSPWYATPLHHVPLSTHLCKIASNKLLEKALLFQFPRCSVGGTGQMEWCGNGTEYKAVRKCGRKGC